MVPATFICFSLIMFIYWLTIDWFLVSPIPDVIHVQNFEFQVKRAHVLCTNIRRTDITPVSLNMRWNIHLIFTVQFMIKHFLLINVNILIVNKYTEQLTLTQYNKKCKSHANSHVCDRHYSIICNSLN